MNTYKDLSPQRWREIMGNFCSGVTIITSTTVEGPVGFTSQSFTSLSMEPPLIAFNVMNSSTSWPKIRQGSSFCVNILAAGSEALSTQFAKSGTDKFAGVNYRLSELGNPILEDTLVWIDCTLYAEYDGGDHTIIIGQVDNMQAQKETDPLVFFRGKYTAVEKVSVPSY